MSESTGSTVECPICGEAFDPTAAGGWCTNADCGEYQYDGAVAPEPGQPGETDGYGDDPFVEPGTTGEDTDATGSDDESEEPAPDEIDGVEEAGDEAVAAAIAGDADSADGASTPAETDEPEDVSSPTAGEDADADPLAEGGAGADSAAAEPADESSVDVDGDADEGAAGPDEGSADDGGGQRDCPDCGESVDADVAFCPSCGADVDEESEAATEEAACPDCGRSVEPDTNFCPGCGADLDDGETTLKTCPDCGDDVDADQSFCAGCGADLDAAHEGRAGGGSAGAGADGTAPDSLVLAARGREIDVDDGEAVGREVRRIITETGGNEDEAVRIHREHVRFVRDDGQFYLVDLGDNPTAVNGRSLAKGDREPVSPGDEVELSGVVSLDVRAP